MLDTPYRTGWVVRHTIPHRLGRDAVYDTPNLSVRHTETTLNPEQIDGLREEGDLLTPHPSPIKHEA